MIKEILILVGGYGEWINIGVFVYCWFFGYDVYSYSNIDKFM